MAVLFDVVRQVFVAQVVKERVDSLLCVSMGQ
jgi:hypothetical protein